MIDASTVSGISGAAADSALNLRIARVGGVTCFDPVSLSVIPEPATVGLIGMEGAAAILRPKMKIAK